MTTAGVSPNERSWNTLMKAFAFEADTSGAQRVFDDMIATGVSVSRRTLNTLLLAFANAKSVAGCDLVLERMRSEGFQIDEVSALPT